MVNIGIRDIKRFFNNIRDGWNKKRRPYALLIGGSINYPVTPKYRKN
jgi:hypothetical protein